LSATLSLGVVFAAEYMDSSFRTPSEVVSELNIPVLASVPHRFGTPGQYGRNGNGWAHDVAPAAVDPSVRQA
jgi:hypothetical protein